MHAALAPQFEYALHDRPVHGWGKATVVVAAGFARYGAQIEARPREFVKLIEDDPRPFTVQTEMLLHLRRYFHGSGGIVRWCVGDWRHSYNREGV